MQKFTDAFIKSLKPKGVHFIVREDAPRGEGGFGIRVMKTGAKTWLMVYSFEGKRKWLSLGVYPGLSLSKAREKFREKKKILAEGKDPGELTRAKRQERRNAWTTDKLCDEFLEKYAAVKKRPRSAKEDKLNLARDVRPEWGKRKACDIRRGDVVTLLDKIVSRGSFVQANRTLATIRKMFAWALEREVVEYNPASGVTKPGAETPKERVLSINEVKTVWQNMDKADDIPNGVKKALKLVLLTGCRPGEILMARWDHCDGTWIYLLGKFTKNKKFHRIYMSTLAKQVIGDKGKDFIITKDNGDSIPVYALSYWIRRSGYFGIPHWSPQDLRRTTATRLAEAGTPPHILQRVLNHTQTGITGRVYDQHSYSLEIQTALEKWSRIIVSVLQINLNEKPPENIIPLQNNMIVRTN